MTNLNTSKTKSTYALLLARNEAPSIRGIIDGLYKVGVSEVYVVDGNSTDDTLKIAKDCGANIILGNGNGKASDFRKVLEFFQKTPPKCDAIFAIDADGSYSPGDCPKVVEPILFDETDAVIGTRDKLNPGSMREVNIFGNHLITLAARVGYNRFDLRDILSGCAGYNPKVLLKLQLSTKGFGLEVDILNALLRGKYRVKTVPIDYYPRMGHSKLNLLKDSWQIPVELSRVYVTGLLTNPNRYDNQSTFENYTVKRA